MKNKTIFIIIIFFASYIAINCTKTNKNRNDTIKTWKKLEECYSGYYDENKKWINNNKTSKIDDIVNKMKHDGIIFIHKNNMTLVYNKNGEKIGTIVDNKMFFPELSFSTTLK